MLKLYGFYYFFLNVIFPQQNFWLKSEYTFFWIYSVEIAFLVKFFLTILASFTSTEISSFSSFSEGKRLWNPFSLLSQMCNGLEQPRKQQRSDLNGPADNNNTPEVGALGHSATYLPVLRLPWGTAGIELSAFSLSCTRI